MNRQSFLAGAALLLALAGRAAVTPETLRCEYLKDPLGIDAARPRLSWVLESERRGEKQTAYRILVASSAELLRQEKGDLWDSGRVESDATAQIEYAGLALGAREACFWKVQVWDADGKAGGWSRPARWEMGLLGRSDWSASWITPRAQAGDKAPLVIRRATYQAVTEGGAVDVTETLAKQVREGRLKLKVSNENLGGDPAYNIVKQLRVEYSCGDQTYQKVVRENQTLVLPGAAPLPYLRKSFEVKAPVKRARLYATALGLYEARLNGKRVGDHALAPDWTDYRKRVRYQAYDVTALLKRGMNAVGAQVADGWFSGHIGNGGYQFFGKEPAFLAQLEIAYADGSVERVVTDASWKCHSGPILSSDFMLGEEYDARREIRGWDAPGLDESGWTTAALRDGVAAKLEAQVMEPVRQTGEVKARAVTQPEPGRWVFDLGQNMVGVVRLKVSAPAGSRVTLRHAEMLNPDGTIYTTNLRGAPSVDHYVCRGGGTEVWQPQFTFHGFRYVELSGLFKAPELGAVTGVVLGSDNRWAGSFACSDERLNQLQSNIQWGQRGNYLSVPTDCPQRDERLGWMGDAQVFVRTACYNADVASFFSKWLVDVDDGQTAAGSFSDVVPNTMNCDSVPAWGDAGVICPWTIYETYGDRRILEQHLPAMTKWVEYLRAHSDNLIRSRDRGNDYGDWLSIQADTPKDLIGTAYFAYSTHLLAKSYQALGRAAEAEKYLKLFADIRAAFNRRYVTPEGRIFGNTQCAYAMALKFELLPEELRARAAQYLEDDIRAKGRHLSTGFIGVGYLLPVLAQMGKADTAYQLLRQDTFPSWLFSVKHGATTIWERWDGWTPEKGFQDPGMNSFNHYSLGSCGEFLFGGVGGIRPASPGYKSIRVEPVIRDGLTWAKTSYDSVRGVIATDWKREGNRLTLNVRIPANTTATVCVPAKEITAVKESGRPANSAKGVAFLRQTAEAVEFEVQSGAYSFTTLIR
jgi:alpha-L-rhamnosidase